MGSRRREVRAVSRAASRAVRRVRARRRARTLLEAVWHAERLARLLHDVGSGPRPGRWGARGVRHARRLAGCLARQLALPAGGAAATDREAVVGVPAAETVRALVLFSGAAGAVPAAPCAGRPAGRGARRRRRRAGRREGHAAAQLGAAACLALCRVALDAGEVMEAYARLRQAGRFLAQPAARRPWVAPLTLLLEHAAAVAAATGRAERAVLLATAGAAQRAARRLGLPAAGAAWLDGYLLPARQALPVAARARARAGGRALPLARAVAAALEVPLFPLGVRRGAARRGARRARPAPAGAGAGSWRSGPMLALFLLPSGVEAWAVLLVERLAAVA